jgi:tRNA-Thr(GGU) m(6)t(6)A37 methyltransferase TsaA
MKPIGIIRTCFPSKFGIPRQPGLVPSAHGVIEMDPHNEITSSLRGLEQFSHLWLIFLFHQTKSKKWKPSVRPPRLGGAERIGVLASRSPHRPNPIGMSAVELISVELPSSAKQGARITVAGVDLMDGTPILDIKPYLPYSDSIPNARAGWASEPLKRHEVVWSELALHALDALATPPRFKDLAQELLSLDPRPAFQQRRAPLGHESSNGLDYGMDLQGFDVKWRIFSGKIIVENVLVKTEP